jgi:RNA polymerase sigma-70 factor (ECF subfamily)
VATESWLERIRTGCQEAFGEWIDLQQPKLLRYAQRKLGNQDDAMDVIQETFVAAYQARQKVPDQSDGRQAWLFGIARNKVVDSLRKKARRPESPLPDAEHSLCPVSRSNPSAEAEERIETRRVLAALEGIEEPFREALILVSVEGLSYQEVAALQGVPKGTIRSRVSTARGQLRAALARTEEIPRQEAWS